MTTFYDMVLVSKMFLNVYKLVKTEFPKPYCLKRILKGPIA